jgi:hypothetical protein
MILSWRFQLVMLGDTSLDLVREFRVQLAKIVDCLLMMMTQSPAGKAGAESIAVPNVVIDFDFAQQYPKAGSEMCQPGVGWLAIDNNVCPSSWLDLPDFSRHRPARNRDRTGT